jgi:hypothetical protein
MALILTPTSPLIAIDLYYVEETKPAGTVIFHFINSPEDMAKWRSKGYHTLVEIKENQTARQQQAQQQRQNQLQQGRPTGAGAPIEKNTVEQNTVSEKIPEFDPSKIISIVHTEWKKLSWKDQNQIFSRALRTNTTADGKTTTELDSILYRDLKLKHCLKKWDVKNEDGEPVPANSETIDQLVPEVAQEMLSAFERITEPTADDLKN